MFAPFPCHFSEITYGPGITLIDSKSVSDSGANCGTVETISFSSTPTSRQLILLAVSNTVSTVTAPTGFTELGSANKNCQVFYKVAGGSETNSYQVTYLGSSINDGLSFVGTLWNGPIATPIDTQSSSANTRTAPSITTSFNNEEIILVGGSTLTATDFVTQPAGYTSAVTKAANTVNLNISYVAQAVAGATGTNNYNIGTYAAAKVFTIGVRSV